MTLQQRFSAHTLTTDQLQALDALEGFFRNPHAGIFILQGYAGTGKTFLMQGVAAWLGEQARTVKYAAPTNRAAKLLQFRTQTPVLTLHKLLYHSVEGAFQLAARPDDWGPNPVLVVDEASMLGNFTPEQTGLRFGSGQLLNDLMNFIDLRRFPQSKLIFVGDGAQLPPVGMRFSPALSVAALRQFSQTGIQQATLKEVVRQKAGSGILQTATQFRRALESNQFSTRLPLEPSKDLRIANGSRLLSSYFQQQPKEPCGKQIILAYTNEATEAYNKAVRQHYFGASESLCQGEFLLVTNNLPDLPFPLTNGELVKVLQVGTLEQKQASMKRGTFKELPCPLLTYTEEVITATFCFRNAVVAFRNQAGEAVQQRVKILENSLFLSEQEQLPPAVSFLLKRLAGKEFFNSNRLLFRTNRARFDAEQKAFVQKNLYANALIARFGYAITCHKAQGGEWERVFVDLCAPIQRDSAGFYRWSYTALTRASKQVFLRLNPHDQPRSVKREAPQQQTRLSKRDHSIALTIA